MSVKPDAKCVYHIFPVEVSNRDEVIDHFKKLQIGCGIHYPIPLHLQPALAYLGYKKGDFPVAEAASQRMLSLPMYAELSHQEANTVCEQFLKVAKN